MNWALAAGAAASQAPKMATPSSGRKRWVESKGMIQASVMGVVGMWRITADAATQKGRLAAPFPLSATDRLISAG
ncbi:hypothetical protein GCM10011320_15380 [Neoroseomonas lacus]|uniref:Uncharacterized protein n=1 Tax=Neoroseomonas lacus TaxID=287609 RepID=A0A917NLC1_9PROT|nr:hypothetical protein GCM10011320_15380 [Neoroseomonas lacus]